MSKNYKVAITGRVNVGKSTLFNKLISSRKAIISPVAGTTRDRNYAVCTWKDLDFYLVDTGGLERQSDDDIDKQISEQAISAIEEADLLLFVVDIKTGIMPTDTELSKYFKKIKKPVILVANKTDHNRLRNNIAEFYKLNMDKPWPISASSGIGTGDLLDEVVKTLKGLAGKKKKSKTIEIEEAIKVAIVGKPNVGKSSIINAILGEDRAIVSATPHTTRDSQDIEVTYEGKKIIFVDTAGLRRHSKKSADAFEKLSIEQSLQTIRRVDIAVLVTDVSKKLTWQDKKLIDEANESGTGIIILANKWDLIPDKDTATIQEYDKYYKRFFPFITWAPILYTSATKNIRIKKMLSLVLSVFEEKNRTISENALDKLLKKVIKKHKPSRGKGTNHPYIYSLKQTRTNPPTFAVKMNFKADLHLSYLRFIENNLRYKFGLLGTPIKIYLKKSQNTQDK
ncbi:ribosome biogenesis GTPase Der [Candidatus Parcubacteria bacterium]|jgi:GTPase|nr:ribosome biogenesis GTPase Der [Candidatus Parcubacteria bacterium]